MMQQSVNNPIRDRAAQITIHQQNTNKSLVMQSDFLHQLDPTVYNLAAIQELYMDHNHNSCTGPHWYTIYPKEHYFHSSKTRSLLLVNNE